MASEFSLFLNASERRDTAYVLLATDEARVVLLGNMATCEVREWDALGSPSWRPSDALYVLTKVLTDRARRVTVFGHSERA
jgi:hypothetical protein